MYKPGMIQPKFLAVQYCYYNKAKTERIPDFALIVSIQVHNTIHEEFMAKIAAGLTIVSFGIVTAKQANHKIVVQITNNYKVQNGMLEHRSASG